MTRSRALVAVLFSLGLGLVATTQAADAPPAQAPAAPSGADATADADIQRVVKSWGSDAPGASTKGVLWSRFGFDPLDSRLAGDLQSLVAGMRVPSPGLPNWAIHPPARVEGVAPHRRATLSVVIVCKPQMYEVLLVEDGEWLAVRADKVAPSAPPPAPADRVLALATVSAIWKAIDSYDTKTFVPLCGEWKDGRVVDGDAKGLEGMLEDFHQKYGLRPRRLLLARTLPDGEIEIPALIGDREVLLLCGMRKDAKGAWRLTRVSDGDPTSVPDDATAK